MALRGTFSKSFLRSTELISFSEISYDKDGNYIFEKGILREALARDNNGKFIRNKLNIANILNKYGIVYRMIFNTMNMEQYTYDEIQEALDYLSNYINDLGVSGIIEFHASDKTQNSDHIHFWISTEDKLIYNNIAKEMVAMGYSNEEDVYIQKYEENRKLNKSEYVNSEDISLSNRFLLKPIGMEAGETLNSINEMLYIKNNNKNNISFLEEKSIDNNLSYLQEKYNLTVNNINSIFFEEFSNKDIYPEFNIKKSIIIEDCTLPRTEEINNILLKIKEFNREEK